ncbi:MAG: LysO family transporter [Desulfovibrio sp.]|uniref:LysO family transporter n=1 Tax=Desulfovibrio sp. TaxID=885 RepID=UPI002A360C07|nr:LysO family transporter [Desulfovibrio sp.]MDY0259168.1 LysO family transporter [Desulfovibrio sp.]
MFIAMGLMFLGIAVGLLLRGRPLAAKLARCVTPAIMLLLFALGISVGGNTTLMANLPKLGGAAVVLTVSAIAGSIACVLCIRRFFRQPPEPDALTTPPDTGGQTGAPSSSSRVSRASRASHASQEDSQA